MTEIPIAKGKQFIKENTDKKVTKKAAKELVKELEAYAFERGDQALARAEQKGRKTVKQKDVRRTK